MKVRGSELHHCEGEGDLSYITVNVRGSELHHCEGEGI